VTPDPDELDEFEPLEFEDDGEGDQ